MLSVECCVLCVVRCVLCVVYCEFGLEISEEVVSPLESGIFCTEALSEVYKIWGVLL